MKRSRIGRIFFCVCACAAAVPLFGGPVEAARGVIARFAGEEVAASLKLELIPDVDGRPVYEIADGGRTLRGSSGVALAKAFYANCRGKNAGVCTWSGSRFDADAAFAPSEDVRVVSPFRYHQMFNVVTYGYSLAFWDEARWMKELDWLALHGRNMALTTLAAEEIAARVWRRLGLREDEIDAAFPGPAYLPWFRMGNLSGGPGSLPAAWRARSVRLQHAVLARMRELGIEPIVPGFAGFLPAAVRRVRPDLKLLEMKWLGGQGPYRSHFLSPGEDAFREIAKMYVEEWEKEFGKATYYLADSFNEMELPWKDEAAVREGLASCGRNVLEGMREANPDAVWAIQGWIFVNEAHIWTAERFAALQKALPAGSMLVLDLAVDYMHFRFRAYDAKPGRMNWDKFARFGGQPWIWSVIPNMGGDSVTCGILDYYANGHLAALASGNRGELVGHGVAPEGIENNEALFELLTEASWKTEWTPVRGWLVNYSRSRYGRDCPDAIAAYWDAMLAGPYSSFMEHPLFFWQRAGGVNEGIGPRVKYEFAGGGGTPLEDFRRARAALQACADALGTNALYRADLAEITALTLAFEADEAIAAGDRAAARRLLRALDGTLEGHPCADLGAWLSAARAAAEGDEALADAYERNARSLVTVWGPCLNDYSARVWHGLVGSYYLPRLETYWAARDAKRDPAAAVEAFSRRFVDGLAPVAAPAVPDAVEAFIKTNWTRTVRENTRDDGTLIGLPRPYTVPCASGRFQEFYYWDTYFTNLGLLRSGRTDVARDNCENVSFLIDRYGFMPNGNRTRYLNRSQPPFFTRMVADVFERTGDTAWLAERYRSACREHAFWLTRRTAPGALAHYGQMPPAAERAHAAKRLAERTGRPVPADDAARAAAAACYAALCESGWDCTGRFGLSAQTGEWSCLNALLYGMETDLARFARILGRGDEAAKWEAAAAVRRDAANARLWDGTRGFFCDRDGATGARSDFVTAAVFYPLFTGLATPEQAARIVALLPRLENPHGLAASENRNLLGVQWEWPHGWAPLQWIAVSGLLRYGYRDEALRLAGKYVSTVRAVFARTGALWEKYDTLTGAVSVAKEYESPEMLGWTAGVYLACLDVLAGR